MARFRKKPVVIEAFRPDVDEPPKWALRSDAILHSMDGISIVTLEGTMLVSPGDWIIRGVNGEIYPCKPDIFAKTYEAA